MKTEIKNGVLDFKKNSLIELNNMELNGVNGGSSPPCVILSIKTGYWAAAAVGVTLGLIYEYN